MPSNYIGEIRMFAGTYAPQGWMFCQGQLLKIMEYDVLFNLIGTTYGGDGQDTFQLPDLQGRLPVHQGTRPGGNTFRLGETGGSEDTRVSIDQLPVHSHLMLASGTSADVPSPRDSVIGVSSTVNAFINSVPSQPMAADVSFVGGSQSHTNMQPYLCLNFIISLEGIFPTPS